MKPGTPSAINLPAEFTRTRFENPRPASIPRTNDHPWKVIPNGDNTLHVGPGSIYSYDEVSLTLREFKYFAGTVALAYSPIPVPSAGSLYGRIPAAAAFTPDINYGGSDSNGDTFTVQLLRVFPDAAQDVLFSVETTPPAVPGTFYFHIAEVDLVGGIATITRQILTHNPTLQSWIEPP